MDPWDLKWLTSTQSSQTYDNNSKLCPALKPGDKWYLIGGLGFCGLVLLILFIVGLQTYVKNRLKARRLQEPNPDNELVIDNMTSPLMDSAAPPAVSDPYYGIDEEKRYDDPYAEPEALVHVPIDPYNPPEGYDPYGNLVPMDPSSSWDHSGPSDPGHLQSSASHYSHHPTSNEYISAADQFSPPSSDDDHNLQTPYGYPRAGMTRSGSSYHSGLHVTNAEDLPIFPPPVSRSPVSRSPMKSPMKQHTVGGGAGRKTPLAAGRKSIRSPFQRKSTSPKNRMKNGYGRTPPLPERPLGLSRYASGIDDEGSSEDDPSQSHHSHLPYGELPGSSTYSHSQSHHSFSQEGGQPRRESQMYRSTMDSIDDGYLYEIPTMEAVDQTGDAYRSYRKFYGGG